MTNAVSPQKYPHLGYDFIHVHLLEQAAHDFQEFLGHFNSDELSVDTDMAYCEEHGHDIYDCSSAGPDSGNMDHECVRCGQYWSVSLY